MSEPGPRDGRGHRLWGTGAQGRRGKRDEFAPRLQPGPWPVAAHFTRLHPNPRENRHSPPLTPTSRPGTCPGRAGRILAPGRKGGDSSRGACVQGREEVASVVPETEGHGRAPGTTARKTGSTSQGGKELQARFDPAAQRVSAQSGFPLPSAVTPEAILREGGGGKASSLQGCWEGRLAGQQRREEGVQLGRCWSRGAGELNPPASGMQGLGPQGEWQGSPARLRPPGGQKSCGRWTIGPSPQRSHRPLSLCVLTVEGAPSRALTWTLVWDEP